MDEEYDVVICGTGLTECILSGLLSTSGKKVLHIDRNNYYGGESASLNLTTLYNKFRPGAKPPASYGANRDWNVDLIPKFVMASGDLVKILLKTHVTRYLEWQVIEGTYVYQFQRGGLLFGPKFIHKVPATEMEAIKSPLLGLMEKNSCRSFFSFILNWEDDDKSTHMGFDREGNTMSDIYSYFRLSNTTIDFIGHAIALYTTDDYIERPFGETLDKIRLYMMSISRYGQSPFIYPVYGLGGLPEGFSRLCAIHGGTFMLNTDVEKFIFDESGKVSGVSTQHGQAKCKMVICDPSYVLNFEKPKVQCVGKVIRCICILNAPIQDTNNASSCQIIIPQNELKRKHDIYVMMISSTHGVALKGKYIAIISTTIETDNPLLEINPALKLLGNTIEEQFVYISDIYKPLEMNQSRNEHFDNIFISRSCDATSHFETLTEDVLYLWETITGSALDLTDIPPNDIDEK
ncbi:GDP dissociation inhibitor family protein [Cryptosporidium andersoni]|uniref:Rab GDP dissociation inhibitor n=1 Tax=Cryptosporidium andersoni TaxID=117008 RepID=A0A1J4MQX6_9CRYT|nr:GDP dissociation inhibitor family protein [Cryptosporidium andersoni]